MALPVVCSNHEGLGWSGPSKGVYNEHSAWRLVHPTQRWTHNMKLKDNQRRVSGKLKRLKPRFGILPTRVQTNPKAYRRRPKHQTGALDPSNDS